jgi:hypothetical protein
MTFVCGCCGAEVVGRTALVCIAIGAPKFDEKCPACGRWAEFTVVEMVETAKPRRKAA